MSNANVLKIEQEIARFEELKNYFSVDFEKGLITRIKLLKKDQKNKIGDIVNSICAQKYIQFHFKDKNIKAHRFIFYCYHGWLPEFIDHKNTIRDDNRISNLRHATRRQNSQNLTKARSDNKSGFLGVHFHKKEKKYVASIQTDGKLKHLGSFETPQEAHIVYLAAKRIDHEFCTI